MDSLRENGSGRLHPKKAVCADHFTKDDYQDSNKKSLGLKRSAVAAPNVIEGDNSSNSNEEQEPHSDDSWGDDAMSNSSMPIEVHDSESNGPLYASKRTPSPTIHMLKKRLLDSEKLNSRLKRAVDRLRRQNVKFKNKLIEKESQA